MTKDEKENSYNQQQAIGSFECTSCGANLKYQPGTQHLNCEYCGAINEIQKNEGNIWELDFNAYLSSKSRSEGLVVKRYVTCVNCGATLSLEENITSQLCPYCATPIVLEHAHDEEIIQPKSLLPFNIDKETAKTHFKKWIKKLWFAPNDLKKAVLNFDHFKGIYIPYWTYDTATYTHYTGQRGEYYYVTESYTTTVDGKSVTRTRTVRKTRWYPASGNVKEFFDDILVPATKSLPSKYIFKLEPWDLQNLVPYDKNYLSGFISEKYQLDLSGGFSIAQERAEPIIRRFVKQDIGGDTQTISSLQTSYSDITFKHLLLPVYVSAYTYKKKLFQFLVNGRTGEVQGKRPYSWIKITLTVLLGLAIIGGFVFAAQQG